MWIWFLETKNLNQISYMVVAEVIDMQPEHFQQNQEDKNRQIYGSQQYR